MGRKPKQFGSFPISYSDADAESMFRAACEHVVDGDTVDLLLDLGWYHYAYESVRFQGIDTVETRGTTGQQQKLALAAYRRTEELLLNKPVLVRSFKQRKSFERFLADVYFVDVSQRFPEADSIRTGAVVWRLVSDVLLAEGLATPWSPA